MDSLTYQSLSDPHLNAYFQNKRIRQHLIKAGLINRRGDILSDKEQKTVVTQEGKRRRAKRELSHRITDYIIEEERRRQVFIRNYFDFALKRSRVKQIREPKHRTIRSLPRRVRHRVDHTGSRTPSSSERSRTPPNHRSPKRAKSAHRTLINVKNQLAHRSISGKRKSKHDYCRVTMIYYGPLNDADQKRNLSQSNSDEIMVLQQHCGGENLPVFKGFVRPNETFSFDSRRHPEYPFALALYINGLFVSRISVCCEYKHAHNVRLGSRYGLFGIYDVQNSQPCRICRFEEHKKKLFSMSTDTGKSSSYRKTMVTTGFPLEILLRTPIESSKQEKTTSKPRFSRISTDTQTNASPRRLSSPSLRNKTEINQSDTRTDVKRDNYRKSPKTLSRTSTKPPQSEFIKSFSDNLHHSSEPILNRNDSDDSRSSNRNIKMIQTPTSLTHEDRNQKLHRSSESSSRISKKSKESSSVKSFDDHKVHHSSEPVSNRRNTDDSRSSITTIELAQASIPFKHKDMDAKNRHSSQSSSRTSKESRQSSSMRPSQDKANHSSKPVSNRRNTDDSRSSSTTIELAQASMPFKHEDTDAKNRHSSQSSSRTSKKSRQSSSVKSFEDKVNQTSEPVSNRQNTDDSRSSSSTTTELAPTSIPFKREDSNQSTSSTSQISSSSSTISLGVTNNNRLRSNSSSSSFSLEKENDQPTLDVTSTKDQGNELLLRPPSRAASRSSSSHSQSGMSKDLIKKKYLSSDSSTTESNDDTLKSKEQSHILDINDRIDHIKKNKHRFPRLSTSSSESIQGNKVGEKYSGNQNADSSSNE